MNRKLFATLVSISIISIILVPVAVGNESELASRGTSIRAINTCTITSPTDGATVSGTIVISVYANKLPTIYIDGTNIGKGYTVEWDTTTVIDGLHTIKAVNRDAIDEITVSVDNGGGEPGTGDGVVKKWALCIGISDYEGTANDLSYCDEDAEDWEIYLLDQGYTVITLLDTQATYSNILASLQDIADAEDADDMVAITYSGHGYYDRGIRQSSWVSHDIEFIYENIVEAITDTYDSTSVFWFNDCCNIGTYENLANPGWVMAQGSTKTSYTYDGTPEMQNGIFTYYAMVAISLGYNTAEGISNYAINYFNSVTPGRAYLVDNYNGELVL